MTDRWGTYPGGKSGAGVYQVLINQIPPHDDYFELFAGGAAILRLKRPAARSLAMDADPRAVARLQALTPHLPGLTVLQGDALACLRTHPWRGDEFVYLDPPYLLETRSCQRALYACEYSTIEEHAALLAVVRQVPAHVMLSGYWSDLYAAELADWRTLSYTAVTRGGRTRQEQLWMNYPEPLELHDYRYLGSDYRERERIKRKRDRWRRRLAAMPRLERLAILAAVDDLRSGTTGDDAGSTTAFPGDEALTT